MNGEKKFLDQLVSYLRSDVNIERDNFSQENKFLFRLWKGKFLRSQIVYLVCQDLKKELGRGWRRIALHLAAGIELIHLASLIHDDIIDQAITRRSLVTFYRKFGFSSAIVWGDWLFARGMEEFAQVGASLSAASAIKNICEGQLLEEKLIRYRDISWQSYYEIIANKTASLFAAGIDALKEIGLDSNMVDRYADYAFVWGICFQVYDDILDLEEDFLTKKITFPVVLLKWWRFKKLRDWWQGGSSELEIPKELKSRIYTKAADFVSRSLSSIQCPKVLEKFDIWLREKISLEQL